MKFEFTEEQNLLRTAFVEFVKEEVAPNAAKWDEEDYTPVELMPKMGEMGILGIFVPEEYGGVGLGQMCIRDRYGKEKCFSPKAMKILQNYSWPGNIRELENVVERLMLISQNDVIKEDDVTTMLFDDGAIDNFQYEGISLEEAIAITEKNLIKKDVYKRQSQRQRRK